MNISEVKVGDNLRVVGDRAKEKPHVVVAIHGKWVGLADAETGEVMTGEPPHQSSNRIARTADELEPWDE